MKISALSPHVDDLWKRALPEGGFAGQPGRAYRPDATAWAMLALAAANVEPELLRPAGRRLTESQLKDGRLPISPGHPDVVWPTPIAVLAWHDIHEYDMPRSNAINFLLNSAGTHSKREANSPLADDPSIKGWPWVLGTYSWIEPTALTIIALRASGYGGHERTREGIRMLLDRQLPGGGWNYGNTLVFGKELDPMPEDTGVALAALEGTVPGELIRPSLDYLSRNFRNLLTPLALGYGLLGLAAHGTWPAGAEDSVVRCSTCPLKFDFLNQ